MTIHQCVPRHRAGVAHVWRKLARCGTCRGSADVIRTVE
jgi:hypothetical protein